MADKQWTMNCVLAGIKLSQLIREDRMQEAVKYLGNLTSEFSTVDVNYLLSIILAMLKEERGE